MEKKKRRYFPDEFNRQAAERVETSGLSIMDVAAEEALDMAIRRQRPVSSRARAGMALRRAGAGAPEAAPVSRAGRAAWRGCRCA